MDKILELSEEVIAEKHYQNYEDEIKSVSLIGSELIEPIPHNEILEKLIDQIKPIDFKALAFPEIVELRSKLKRLNPDCIEAETIKKHMANLTLTKNHLLILSVENVLKIAERNKWGICKNQEFVYFFNGTHWALTDENAFQKFLGEASEKMGVGKFVARHYQFREQIFKQFLATGYLPTPQQNMDSVFINLKNGTFEVKSEGNIIRAFDQKDFLTYQLPFEYCQDAKAPKFQNYLDEVLPDKERQMVLAEYLGYVFIKHGCKSLKEEKTLILYGSGANGKSVFFEVVNALLGNENVSSYSLQSLTDGNGYYRAMIANKLVNYASEINGKLETSIFKQLVSGEPIEARLPYGRPMQIKQYAKMIFNCNELPKDVEQTNAYFRRFLIIPFDITIPESKQDKQLHMKIIENELSGVFNWILDGLYRLLKQKGFTNCEAAKRAVEQYKLESDSVNQFLEENSYVSSPNLYKKASELFFEYRYFCSEDGMKPVKKQNFYKRLKNNGFIIEKRNVGNVVYLTNELGLK